MKCNQCGKTVKQSARTCKFCGNKFIRQSDQLARRMTLSANTALGTACFLVFFGAILLFNGLNIVGTIVLGLGILIGFVSRKME